MNEHLVSICLPTCNNSKYIQETLDSLANQSYKNIELIVSNNVKDDETCLLVNNYKLKNNRVIYSQNDKNLGYVKNVNKAVEQTRSDYIAIYHTDDVYDKTIIEKEVNALENNKDIDAVFTLSRIFYTDTGKKVDSWVSNVFHHSNVEYRQEDNIFVFDYEHVLNPLAEVGNFFVCPTFMTRKEVYMEIGGYNNDYPSNEDINLWLRYLKNGKNIAIIDEMLISYRISNVQTSNNYLKNNEIDCFFKVIEEMVYNDFNNTSKKKYKRLKSNEMINVAKRRYLSGNSFTAKEILNESKKYYYFKIYTKNGLLQRFFLLFMQILKLIKEIIMHKNL